MSRRTPSRHAALASFAEVRAREASFWRLHRIRAGLRIATFVLCLGAIAVAGAGLGYAIGISVVQPKGGL